MSGDFNYDGLAGTSVDYYLMDYNYGGDALTQRLPEPGSVALLLLLAVSLPKRGGLAILRRGASSGPQPNSSRQVMKRKRKS